MQEVARVGIEQRLRLRREVFGGPSPAPGGKVHIAFRAQLIEVGAGGWNNG